jgi:hypothetical protein
VRAVTGRVFLDIQSGDDDQPGFAERGGRAFAIDIAGRRDGGKETLRMLERVLRGREARSREGAPPSRHYAQNGRHGTASSSFRNSPSGRRFAKPGEIACVVCADRAGAAEHMPQPRRSR